MRKHIHEIVLLVAICALIICCTVSCAAFKKAGLVAGGAAAGAGVGLLAGPGGAIAGAAAGATIASTTVENDSLQSGDTVGREAMLREIETLKIALAQAHGQIKYEYVPMEVEKPFIPNWVWWVAVIAFLYFRGHKIVNAWRLRTFQAWIEVFLPKRTIIPKKPKIAKPQYPEGT